MREIAPASLGEIPEEEFVKPPGMTQNALTELLNKIGNPPIFSWGQK